jgi:ribokinase
VFWAGSVVEDLGEGQYVGVNARNLVVIGDANPDLVLTGDVVPRFGQAEQLLDGATLTMGGSASIMACGAARLGVPTRLIAHVGDDQFGHYVLETLEARGVDTLGIVRHRQSSTGLSVILSEPHDRSILTNLGVMTSVNADDLDLATLGPGTHVHAAAYFLLPSLAEGLSDLFARLHLIGCTTSLDTNWDPTEQWGGLDDVLQHTDIFFPNEQELCAITAIDDVERAAAAITAAVRLVVVKRGKRGGLLRTSSGECHHRPPEAPLSVVDTTGAGDSFDAGFLSAWLRDLPLTQCLSVAVAAGGLSTRAAGGITSQATWDEVEPR